MTRISYALLEEIVVFTLEITQKRIMKSKEFQICALNSMNYPKRLNLYKKLRLASIFQDHTYISKFKRLKYFKLNEKIFN
jgi:hypothetical protein